MSLNLAREPFVNRRPVERLALVMWTLGASLFLVNVLLYWNYLADSVDKRARQAQLGTSIDREEERISQLEAEVESLDLEHQNEQVAFLNWKIAERTFSWSRLFNRLAEVLPERVRLNSLSPRTVRPQGRGSASFQPGEQVILYMVAEAKDGEALLEFIDALFRHPAFKTPKLRHEAKRGGGVLGFDLEVTYLPEIAEERRTAVAEAGSSEGGAPESGVGSPSAAMPGTAPPQERQPVAVRPKAPYEAGGATPEAGAESRVAPPARPSPGAAPAKPSRQQAPLGVPLPTAATDAASPQSSLAPEVLLETVAWASREAGR